MKCLIIAAGKGSRLSKKGDTKPLVSLLGLPLIERVIITAKKSGLSDFYVVTGYNGKNVEHFLEKLALRRDVKITTITNAEWKRENGVSVLKANELLNENFILLMGDHIFNEDTLKRLKSEQVREGEVILAVDYNTNGNHLVDVGDVTKVYVDNGKIIDIGKNISRYNAYDTGIFLCSQAVFSAITASIVNNGKSSLSGGIKLLAEKGKVKPFDIKNNFWIDVDDEKAFQKAEKVLLERLKKSSDGPISRYCNRPLSAKITRYLIKTRITPNQISFFSFLLSTVAALCFFVGSYTYLALGAVLAQLSSIIDGCDGEVARLKDIKTDFGGWFDAVLDRYADAFLLFGLTWYVYSLSGSLLTLFTGFLAIIGTFMNSYTADKYDGLMKKKIGQKGSYFRIGRDVRIAIIFLGCLINQPFITLLVIALLMNLENVRRVQVLCRNG
jgi:CDP-L-myo-inositol myo-inositolphosphotransferase